MSCKRCTCAIAATLLLASQNVMAQHSHARAAAPVQLPIIIDGSITPDQIPDSLAYRHFLTAIAAHPVPTPDEQARQAAQLSPLGLSATDRQALITGLAPFRTQLDSIESARASVTPSTSAAAQLTALESEANSLVANTLQSVRQSLTADGMSRLDQYVQTHVKSHIRIYGGTH